MKVLQRKNSPPIVVALLFCSDSLYLSFHFLTVREEREKAGGGEWVSIVDVVLSIATEADGTVMTVGSVGSVFLDGTDGDVADWSPCLVLMVNGVGDLGE